MPVSRLCFGFDELNTITPLRFCITNMAPVGYVQFSWWWICILAVLWMNGCYSQNSYDLRLVGGDQPNKGRVEIYLSLQWMTICDNYNWGQDEARVVCRQLGYGDDNVVVRRNAYFGQGTSDLTRQLRCSGAETRVSYCSVEYAYCSHADDAGVECGYVPTTYNPYPWPIYTTYDFYGRTIRLMDGDTPREGRVEIFYNGQWNTICDDYWDLDEAEVVCRQLGYDSDGAIARTSAYFGQGSGPIRSIQCHGYESSLSTCTNTPADSVCYHFEDAGVTCRQNKTSSRVIGVMSFVGVALFLLTIVAMVAVLYTCRKQHKPTPAPREMVPLSTVTTPPAPAPDTATTAPLQVALPV